MSKIERALLSVSDKTGLVEFAGRLAQLGVELISTGGTARHLREAGLAVREIADLTEFPEIMDGRVKSLHPVIYAGILARRDSEDHLDSLRKHRIQPIDLVVVNLYPFQQTIAQTGVTLEEAVEQIDIGGPALVRAAAKNHAWVTVIVDPSDYAKVEAELVAEQGRTRPESRRELAAKAFHHTGRYDLAIAAYLANQDVPADELPSALALDLRRTQRLRYGENPHQRGALYRLPASPGGVADAQQLHGKELSFNNWLDLDAAWALGAEFDRPFCGIIKHTNPCGAAVGDLLSEALVKALDCDPVSAFGSIIVFNRGVDEPTAEAMQKLFVEAVIAPAYESGALQRLQRKKNLRIMKAPVHAGPPDPWNLRSISGGVLLQDPDRYYVIRDQLKVASRTQPTPDSWDDLLFGWRICKHVKSNAIVIASQGATAGIGAGQMSRVDAVKLAREKAGTRAAGAVLASDAFFPFRDSIDRAAEAGIKAIIQPGGSIRDQEVIEAADEHGIALVLTGIRHFKH